MISDKQLIHELEVQVRHTPTTRTIAVSVYTLLRVFDRLADAEQRVRGVSSLNDKEKDRILAEGD